MKKLLPLCAVVSFLLTACVGHDPHPVEIVQPRDEVLSCHALDDQIEDLHNQMEDLLPHTDKSGQNAAMGILGVPLIVPLYFIDLKEGEKVEYNAMVQRSEHLKVIRMDHNCPTDPQTIRSKRLGYSFSDK